jgi:outer membrane protein assembly factor BamA
MAGIQASGSLADLEAVAAFTSRRHRANWSLAVQQVPLRLGAFSLEETTIDGEPAVVERETIFRQINREASLGVSYPFSRTRRLDGWVSARRLSFDIEQRTAAFSLNTGALLLRREQSLDAPASLNLGQASLAYVTDNAILGAVSPLLGKRARLEVSPTFGALTFATVTADLRRYVMPVRPLTLAGRFFHYGRYGGDAEDPRLSPIFLGYDGLVRGYPIGSFSPAECVAPVGQPDACPAFDRLVGSRVMMASVELRAPIFRLLGIGSGYYGGPLPVELALFADGGVAWDDDNPLSFSGDGREPVFSTGAALRVNLLGFLLLEGALVRPLDRPGRGWLFQLSFLPGF